MPKNPRDLRSNNGASIVTFTHSISITGSTNERTAASLWKYASMRWSMYSDGRARARERFFTSFHSGPFVRSLALPLSRLPESHFAFLHGSNFKSSSIFIRYFWERRRRRRAVQLNFPADLRRRSEAITYLLDRPDPAINPLLAFHSITAEQLQSF